MEKRLTAPAMDEEGLVVFIALLRRWAGREKVILDSFMLCSFGLAGCLTSFSISWYGSPVLYGLLVLLTGVTLYTFVVLSLVRPAFRLWIYHRVIARDIPLLKLEVRQRLREVAPDVYQYLQQVCRGDTALT
jgi:hypothetical protein